MKAGEQERGMSFQDEREPLIVHYDIELDDAGLDPYQFRAYQRIARRCMGAPKGQCFESLESMAIGCKMSRPTLVRSIKVLIQRGMIRRLSRQGATSYYALTDKKHWVNLADYEAQKERQPGKPQSRVTSEPGKPESQGVVNHRTTTRSTTEPGGGSVVYTKKTHEENTEGDKEERVRSPLSITQLLIAAYQNIATTYREQTDLTNQAILLESGQHAIEEVEEWLTSRRSLSSINFIARDFKTWLANKQRSGARSISSSAETDKADRAKRAVELLKAQEAKFAQLGNA